MRRPRGGPRGRAARFAGAARRPRARPPRDPRGLPPMPMENAGRESSFGDTGDSAPAARNSGLSAVCPAGAAMGAGTEGCGSRSTSGTSAGAAARGTAGRACPNPRSIGGGTLSDELCPCTPKAWRLPDPKKLELPAPAAPAPAPAALPPPAKGFVDTAADAGTGDALRGDFRELTSRVISPTPPSSTEPESEPAATLLPCDDRGAKGLESPAAPEDPRPAAACDASKVNRAWGLRAADVRSLPEDEMRADPLVGCAVVPPTADNGGKPRPPGPAAAAALAPWPTPRRPTYDVAGAAPSPNPKPPAPADVVDPSTSDDLLPCMPPALPAEPAGDGAAPTAAPATPRPPIPPPMPAAAPALAPAPAPNAPLGAPIPAPLPAAAPPGLPKPPKPSCGSENGSFLSVRRHVGAGGECGVTRCCGHDDTGTIAAGKRSRIGR